VGPISSLDFTEREKSLRCRDSNHELSPEVRVFVPSSPSGEFPRTFTRTFFSLAWVTRWRSWLRHYTTSRKVAGWIPDGVIEIFHSHDSSGRTVALGSTQPLTEKSTGNTSSGVKSTGPRADNPTTFVCQLS
jgi:hypothetical protein